MFQELTKKETALPLLAGSIALLVMNAALPDMFVRLMPHIANWDHTAAWLLAVGIAVAARMVVTSPVTQAPAIRNARFESTGR